ncbi:glycine--tRNA ligase subunit beta [uncultured Tateyamaria sp.]|uniref:glycine--tRNA ligase subunit beta n=1 Tax=Tateyamaria sp. 1078 TaxID=3417464 RepID=UPI002631FD32|nr:glycine--tRNA ligase subunit beta [uncultured Tateyamaria sp.]
MPDLLIELFSEEIPARMQTRAGEDLKKLVTNGLVEAGLTYASAAAFTTPRRLTLTVDGLLDQSPTTREERKGPKADAPEKAIEGFLRGAGLTRDQVEERETPKGSVLFAVIEKPGRPASHIIAEVLEATIRQFPWPKSMRWGTGSLKWVRPLQSILCILTDEAGHNVVPLDVDGIVSGDTTEGHRFMAPGRFAVTGFDDYVAKLKRAHVVLDAAERAQAIWHDATNMAFASGLEVVEDKGLLSEVAGLVEWPVVLMGRIGDDFLELPPEVLQTSMKEHQKFFSVRNPKTGRIERFITVANRETADNGATILAGNEKVLSARLADAKFFWENDLRTVREVGLEGMAKLLADVTFHNKLGSQAERVARIEALARELASVVGAKPDLAAEAARVCKADLASEMVYEFPELQGTMGKYYARAAGHDDGVPEACEEHYSPLGPSDDVPTASVSVAVALADKLDTLTGFWAIDEKPTGSKDPFALRRAALGVIRLVLENDVRIPLGQWIFMRLAQTKVQNEFVRKKSSADEISKLVEQVDLELARQFRNSAFQQRYDEYVTGATLKESEVGAIDLLAFFHDRLKVYLRDQSIRHDIIDACIAMPQNDDLALLVNRATALSDTLKTDDGENLIQGFKRANNILTQAEEADGVEYSYGADAKFAETEEERALFAALDTAEAKIAPAMDAQDFASAMHAMATLRTPIDAFFDAVQINTDNQTIRRNRLNLLSRIRTLCLSVADLTKVEG